MIVKPPMTDAGAKAILEEGYECADWWFCTKEL